MMDFVFKSPINLNIVKKKKKSDFVICSALNDPTCTEHAGTAPG